MPGQFGPKRVGTPIITPPFVKLIIQPLMECYNTIILLRPLEIGRLV